MDGAACVINLVLHKVLHAIGVCKVSPARMARRCRAMESFHATHKPEFHMQIKTLVGALAMTLAGLAMAQPSTPNLDKREAKQQQRIPLNSVC